MSAAMTAAHHAVSNPTHLRAQIRVEALALGFDAVGFTEPAAAGEAGKALAEYLERGYHGDMGWLATRASERADPAGLWDQARSVIMVGLNYGPADDPLAVLERHDRGALSVYAQGRDYHNVMKRRLKALARWLVETYGADVKVFVDTAPVMEKPLAAAAGLGWQGKHTNLVSRDFGSWLFLGAVFTTLAIEPDRAEADHCGTCRACLDVCPTAAFPAAHQLDARRCISYLTIEHKGHIAREFRAAMGNRIFGCDDCLAVCPWNKFAKVAAEPAFLPREGLNAPVLAELAGLDDEAFRRRFAGTAIKRTGRDRFVRNVLIALGNTGDAAMRTVIEPRLAEPSPLVRAMAVWALGEILDEESFAGLKRRHLPRETDTTVQGEWQTARANSPSARTIT